MSRTLHQGAKRLLNQRSSRGSFQSPGCRGATSQCNTPRRQWSLSSLRRLRRHRTTQSTLQLSTFSSSASAGGGAAGGEVGGREVAEGGRSDEAEQVPAGTAEAGGPGAAGYSIGAPFLVDVAATGWKKEEDERRKRTIHRLLLVDIFLFFLCAVMWRCLRLSADPRSQAFWSAWAERQLSW